MNERIPSPALCKFPFEWVKILKSLKYEKAKIGSYEYLRYPVYVILCPIAIITAGILSTWYSVLQLLLPQVFCPHGTLSHSAAQPVTKKVKLFLTGTKAVETKHNRSYNGCCLYVSTKQHNHTLEARSL